MYNESDFNDAVVQALCAQSSDSTRRSHQHHMDSLGSNSSNSTQYPVSFRTLVPSSLIPPSSPGGGHMNGMVHVNGSLSPTTTLASMSSSSASFRKKSSSNSLQSSSCKMLTQSSSSKRLLNAGGGAVVGGGVGGGSMGASVDVIYDLDTSVNNMTISSQSSKESNHPFFINYNGSSDSNEDFEVSKLGLIKEESVSNLNDTVQRPAGGLLARLELRPKRIKEKLTREQIRWRYDLWGVYV